MGMIPFFQTCHRFVMIRTIWIRTMTEQLLIHDESSFSEIYAGKIAIACKYVWERFSGLATSIGIV
jgi:hypothetical protein